MVMLKIKMQNGNEYNIRSFVAKGVKDFLIYALMPGGVQLKWYEVISGEYIQVNQIQSIRIITEEEFEEMNKVKIIDEEESVVPKENDNEELGEENKEPK